MALVLTDDALRAMRRALREQAIQVVVYDKDANELFSLDSPKAIDAVFDHVDINHGTEGG